MVDPDAELDHETDPTLRVIVTAKDAHGESDTIIVTIRVTDVDEKPTISDKGKTAINQMMSVPYNEGGTDAVITWWLRTQRVPTSFGRCR